MDLTIVTYHYVRDPENTGFPAIKARRLAEFRAQLNYIQKNYVPVRTEHVIAAVRGEEKLPAKAIWLTFDDGYIDHFVNVFPCLRERRLQGAFFPPARAVLGKEILDVNKVHFILASAADPAEIVARLRALVVEHASTDMLSFESYWRLHAKASRYDSEEIVFIKRMLQTALPEPLRLDCLNELFHEFVSADPDSFGAELYVSPEQLQEMITFDMYVGGHGDKHLWLNQLTSDQQLDEIDRSLEFLKGLGSSVDHWVMCYPYGANDASLRSHLRRRGCVAGLTVRPAVASIGADDPLMLPRLNTNDMPIQ
jgi:peptidoglycan/xylan/chitin deacetylase (PgdA/CDA1 family)